MVLTTKELGKIFLLSFAVGYIIELILSQYWQYEMLDYYLGVPIFIVFTWMILLTTTFILAKKFQKKYKKSLIFSLLVLFIPITILFETFGSQVLGIVLNVDYPSLFPLTGCCKAPIWVYLLYLGVALVVFPIFDELWNS